MARGENQYEEIIGKRHNRGISMAAAKNISGGGIESSWRHGKRKRRRRKIAKMVKKIMASWRIAAAAAAQ